MEKRLFQELIFNLPTDSVEFSQDQGGNVLAVGMYCLENSLAEKRVGAVSFLRNEQEKCFVEYSKIPLGGGVLDMKWLRNTYNLVVATSQDVTVLSSDRVIKSMSNNDFLYLSLDLLNDKCLVTGSTGICNLIDLNIGDEIASWKAHCLETWCGAFQEESIVWTGADDSLLKVWDLRASSAHPLTVNKSHGAGVCSIVPLSHRDLVATGSYDKHLRLFDMRNLSMPINIIKFDSGVWRIKHFQNKLLLACMNGGFRIVDISNDAFPCEFQVPSDSLAYGCSWGQDGFIACASFYDCKVSIWKDSE
jgi:diphthine methyl ester acylhydrolase